MALHMIRVFRSAEATALLLACMLCPLGSLEAQAQSQQATLKVLYTFKAQGGTPTALVEVSPGTFWGVSGTSPGLFSITSAGTYQFFYMFPPNQQGIVALGLTPALNGKTYGAASNLGTTITFSELFSVARAGKVTTYPYNGATQGGADYLLQGPEEHLYTFFGGGQNPTLVFTTVDYQGNPTPLYTFSPSQGTPYTLLRGAGADFYGVSIQGNSGSGGIFRLTSGGSFSWLVPCPSPAPQATVSPSWRRTTETSTALYPGEAAREPALSTW